MIASLQALEPLAINVPGPVGQWGPQHGSLALVTTNFKPCHGGTTLQQKDHIDTQLPKLQKGRRQQPERGTALKLIQVELPLGF